MLVAGVIAEYNPFHNGHLYHLDKTREYGATHIIAVMSGNFTQRGDMAICDKWARTRMALLGGVDIVIELHVQYAVATAGQFALGSVNTLNSLNCVGLLSFGSECGDISLLKKAAKANLSGDLTGELKSELSAGKTFAAARKSAILKVYGKDIAAVFDNPNDTLGIEYLTALNKLNSKIEPVTIKRHGAMHDSSITENGFASASLLRNIISNEDTVKDYMPKSAFDILSAQIKQGRAPVSLKTMEKAVLWQLRQMTPKQFSKLFDISEGLENKLYKAAQQAVNLEELYSLVKSKRYTHARIRRLILNAALSINNDFIEPPQFIRVLGFSAKGEELLSEISKKSALPLVTSYSQAVKLGDTAKSQFERISQTTDFYTLAMPRPVKCGEEMRQGVIKV